MSQITIVGVEGSGKTVMMAAMGELYERPDANGYFLSPESASAFGFVKTQMAIMHQGRWPAATMTDSIQHFHWSLFRKQPGKPQKIADVSFLDFAGEIYRLAFGEHNESETIEYQKEINSLKKYVRDADTLIVLVNLSDIINGSVSNPRTREAMWLTKSILDFAERSGHPKRSAIVFSQSDTYRDIIESSGGPRATLQRYLPHVANVYEGEVFAVSAVDKTEIDDNGLTIPARDFSSIGLQDLMNWIVSGEEQNRTTLISIAKDYFRNGEWKEAYIAARKSDPSDPEILYIIGRTLEDDKTYNMLLEDEDAGKNYAFELVVAGGLIGFWQDIFAGCGIYAAVKYYAAALKSGDSAIIRKINRRKTAYNLKLSIFPVLFPILVWVKFSKIDKALREFLLMMNPGLIIIICLFLGNPLLALLFCSAIWLIPGFILTMLLLLTGNSWNALMQTQTVVEN